MLSMAERLVSRTSMPKESVGHEMHKNGKGEIAFEAVSPMPFEDIGEEGVLGRKVEKAKGRIGKRKPSTYFDVHVGGSTHWVPSQIK